MNLYVGNLPYQLTEDELSAHFSNTGEVKSVKIVQDRETGRSRGFGFVEMNSADEGNNAIENLNNVPFKGRALVVNEAKPRQPREDRY
jgi:RNA recognition motif-containing protein